MLEAIIWYDKNVLARLRATVKTTKGGGCVDKYKRLVSNTLLFAISTFSSKILSFFLTAYRTRVMGAADYGGMDAIVTIGNFFIPLVSLGIANAIIRFGLEKGVNKRQLYTNGLLSIFAGFLLLCALAPVLNLVPFVRDTVQGHWMWLLLFVLVSCLRTLNCQFVRARNLVRLYALDGILCTLTNLLFNVLFLSGLNLGAQGWILALICSDACSALFLFFVSSICAEPCAICPRHGAGALDVAAAGCAGKLPAHIELPVCARAQPGAAVCAGRHTVHADKPPF